MNFATSISTTPQLTWVLILEGDHLTIVIPTSQYLRRNKGSSADVFYWLKAGIKIITQHPHKLADNEHPVLCGNNCWGIFQLESGDKIRCQQIHRRVDLVRDTLVGSPTLYSLSRAVAIKVILCTPAPVLFLVAPSPIEPFAFCPEGQRPLRLG